MPSSLQSSLSCFPPAQIRYTDVVNQFLKNYILCSSLIHQNIKVVFFVINNNTSEILDHKN